MSGLSDKYIIHSENIIKKLSIFDFEVKQKKQYSKCL